MSLRDSGLLKIRGKELIEDLPIFLKGWFFKKQIVEPFSGARYFEAPFKVEESDHFTIARPESNDSIQHRLLCDFVRNIRNDDIAAVDSIALEMLSNSVQTNSMNLSDPVSLIFAALATGAISAATETTKPVIKNDYNELKSIIKSKLSNRASVEAAVDAHAKQPQTSEGLLRPALKEISIESRC